MEDDMYQLKTNNGINKTFGSFSAAKEYCDNRFEILDWNDYDGNEAREWYGFDSPDTNDASATITLRNDDLAAWAQQAAELHIKDVRSMGAAVGPSDADEWEGLEYWEREALRKAIREQLADEADRADYDVA
jgi:hypothetical protein